MPESPSFASVEAASAERLFPGLGYFGSGPELCAIVDVKGRIDEIVMALDFEKEGFLNLGEINLYGADGKRMRREDLGATVALSSIYNDRSPEDVMNTFLAGRLLHSKAEKAPTLRIRLPYPVDISRIEINNRNDANGRRSRTLSVQCLCGGAPVAEWAAYKPGAVALQQELAGVLGLDLQALAVSGSAEMMAEAIRAALVYKLLSGEASWQISKLIQMLPMGNPKPVVGRYVLNVLAAVVVELMGTQPWIATNRIRFLDAMLVTDTSIEGLSRRISAIVSARAGKRVEMSVAKHRIQRPVLLERRTQYLDSLDQLFPMLEKWGVKAMLCYGSLLGAVRDNAFIPHDDDVDVLYFDGAGSEEEALENRKTLLAKVSEAGLYYHATHYNFHVSVGGSSIDLFPCWRDDRGLWVMMEHYKYRPIDPQIILPPGEVRLYDRTYPAPGRKEAFLQERYGSGWPVSDPYHEWPWKIRRAGSA